MCRPVGIPAVWPFRQTGKSCSFPMPREPAFAILTTSPTRDPGRKHGYVLSVIEGNVGMIEIPSGEELEAATKDVLKNSRLDEATERLAANPLSGIGRAAGKIQHVIYIIKENRTYDEVLGDLPQGNGDPSLVLFGRDVTPNQHALAERFVLFDNLSAAAK